MQNSIIDITITPINTSEPVTRTEAKTQCIVDAADDDTYFDELIKRCRNEMEEICGISIVEKSIVLIADWKKAKKLPYGPVQSLNDVKTMTGTATGGAAEYETPSTYSLDGGLFDMSGCYRLKITYTTGMTTVPQGLKQALLNLIAFRYENRGDHQAELSTDVKRQIMAYKDYTWY